MVKRNILLNPGPATTSDSVKQAQVVPDICPREKEFGDLMEGISRDLVDIVNGGDEYTAVLFGGSGTLGVEAAITSVVPRDTGIVVVNNGAYGKRMVEIAERQKYTMNTIEYSVGTGEPIDLGELEKMLEKQSGRTAIAMVHHETTTGILNPIEEVGKLAKKYGKTFIVDAMSSFAGIPIDAGEAGIDYLISSSNKCIQGMAGLSFVIANKKALEKTKGNARSLYLDLHSQDEYFQKKHQMRFTPPVQTVYALGKAIEELKEEGGVEARHERYSDNWEVLVDGMNRLGFKRFKPEVPQSKILTTFYEPSGESYSFDRMHDSLHEKGFTIYPGKVGEEKTFRLANMGDIKKGDIKNFLGAMKETIDAMRVKE